MTRRFGGRLPHRRVQTWLAIAALGTAVALPVVLLSVGGGVFDHEISELTASGFQVSVTASGAHGVDGAHALAQRIGAIDGVAEASPVLSNSVELFGPAGATPALAEGVVPGPFLATLPPTESPLFPNPLPLGDPTDRAHFDGGSYDGPTAGRVLLSSPIAAAEHVAVGATIQISGDASLRDARGFEVAGLFGVGGPTFGRTAVFGVVLPLSDLQLTVGVARGAGGAVVDAADTVEVALGPAAAADPGTVDRVAAEVQGLAPYYTVTTVSSEATQLAHGQAVLTGFYLGLSAVGLIIGMAFLALLLQREVEVERRSIGVRRALGLPTRTVVGSILVRGYLLALAGTAGGILLGVLLVESLARWSSGDVQLVARLAVFDPATLAGLALLIVATSALASLLAARSAIRRPIPEQLR